jgi:predicted nucleic acid-binding protein
MTYLWDSSAMVAYFGEDDTRLEEFAKDAVTTANNLLEVYYYFFREKVPEHRIAQIDRLSSVVPLTAKVAKMAAKLRLKYRDRKWSYIDAMTYAAAVENALTLVAVGDEFDELPGAIALPIRKKK